MYDVATGEEKQSLEREGGVNAVAWSSDATRVAVGGLDNKVAVYNVATGEEVHSFEREICVYAVAWSSDVTRVAGGGCGRPRGEVAPEN